MILVTVRAMKVAKVRNVPLNVERIFHGTLVTNKMGSQNILKSFSMESQIALSTLAYSS